MDDILFQWGGKPRSSGVPLTGVYDREEEFLKSKEQEKKVAITRPGMYNKNKVITMYGPNGGIGEVYTNGKMYIIYPDGGYQERAFPSRPEAVRTMIKKGWVLA